MAFNRDEYRKQIKEAVDFISRGTQIRPEVGIILGTGLGGLVNEIDIITQIEYHDIPHFPISTV